VISDHPKQYLCTLLRGEGILCHQPDPYVDRPVYSTPPSKSSYWQSYSPRWYAISLPAAHTTTALEQYRQQLIVLNGSFVTRSSKIYASLRPSPQSVVSLLPRCLKPFLQGYIWGSQGVPAPRACLVPFSSIPSCVCNIVTITGRTYPQEVGPLGPLSPRHTTLSPQYSGSSLTCLVSTSDKIPSCTEPSLSSTLTWTTSISFAHETRSRNAHFRLS